MRAIVIEQATGRGLFIVEASPEIVALQPGVGEAAIEAPDAVRPQTHWHDGSGWALRPTVPAPPALAGGVAADWAGVPDGSALSVIDPETGQEAAAETASGTVSLTLPAGPWRIVVDPPFPFRSAGWLIEVAE